MRCRGSIVVISVVAMAACSLLAAGCGGGGSPGVANIATSTTAAETTTQDGAVAYTNCMRSRGVPAFPDPSSGEIPKVSLPELEVSSSQLQAAQQACKSLSPIVSATQQPQVRAKALRLSRCMRNHGITNFPDPDSNGGIRIPDSVENAPGYATAVHACLRTVGPPVGG